MIRDVPHFLLGRIEGSHNVTIYVLFLHLNIDQDRFRFFTDADYTRWFDQVFHPVVHRYYTAHYTQYLPATFARLSTAPRYTRWKDDKSTPRATNLSWHSAIIFSRSI